MLHIWEISQLYKPKALLQHLEYRVNKSLCSPDFDIYVLISMIKQKAAKTGEMTFLKITTKYFKNGNGNVYKIIKIEQALIKLKCIYVYIWCHVNIEGPRRDQTLLRVLVLETLPVEIFVEQIPGSPGSHQAGAESLSTRVKHTSVQCQIVYCGV